MKMGATSFVSSFTTPSWTHIILKNHTYTLHTLLPSAQLLNQIKAKTSEQN